MTEQPSPEQAVRQFKPTPAHNPLLAPAVRLCERCGHSSDVHSHDDVNDQHDATDPDCPFRCNECDCPDFLPRVVIQ